jgi:hypothetical protein
MNYKDLLSSPESGYLSRCVINATSHMLVLNVFKVFAVKVNL